jgi:hypothetical protein
MQIYALSRPLLYIKLNEIDAKFIDVNLEMQHELKHSGGVEPFERIRTRELRKRRPDLN